MSKRRQSCREKWIEFRALIEPELAKVRRPELMRSIAYEKPMGRRKKRAFDKAHPEGAYQEPIEIDNETAIQP